MTENEAKAIVHEIAMNYAENGEEEYCEALDTAIKALEEVLQQDEIKSLAGLGMTVEEAATALAAGTRKMLAIAKSDGVVKKRMGVQGITRNNIIAEYVEKYCPEILETTEYALFCLKVAGKGLADETVRELGITRNVLAKWNVDKLTESDRQTIGRMIDADELIEVLKVRAANEIVHGYMTAYDVTNSIINEVEKQPTAYDPNRVVEQLEKLKKAEELRADDCDEDGCGDSEQIYDDGKSQGRYEALGEAIKIVKDGGTDEEKRHIRTEKKNDKE